MQEPLGVYIAGLHPTLERHVNMTPVKIGDLPQPLPDKCVYLFSERGRALYVGRTNHFRRQMRQHSIEALKHNQAVLAFRLARRKTAKVVVDYSKAGFRSALLSDPDFAEAFRSAKARICKMELRYVEETDPLRQALLEIYVAVALHTPHNDFENH